MAKDEVSLENQEKIFEDRSSREIQRPSEERERIESLLKSCIPHLRPSEEAALAKLKSQPGWENKLRNVNELEDLLDILREDDEYVKQTSILKSILKAEKLKPEAIHGIENRSKRSRSKSPKKGSGLKNYMDIDTRVQKQRFTVHLPVSLIEWIRNAVYWTPGLTISDLAEAALERAVVALEEKRGEAFPPRARDMKGGRPIK